MPDGDLAGLLIDLRDLAVDQVRLRDRALRPDAKRKREDKCPNFSHFSFLLLSVDAVKTMIFRRPA